MKNQISKDIKELKKIDKIFNTASRQVSKFLKKGSFYIPSSPFCRSV